MRSRDIFGLGVVGLIVACSPSCGHNRSTNSHGPELNWVSTSVLYDLQADKKDHSLLFFFPAWCGYAKKLKNVTLADTMVARILGESFNVAQIDPDSDSLVAYMDTTVSCRYMTKAYKVGAFPTTLVLTKQGALIGPIPGYKEPNEFAVLLTRIRDGEFDPH